MNTLTADAVMEQTYLDTRCMLIEVAATLDRVDRAVARSGGLSSGAIAQRDQLQRALEVLARRDAAAPEDDRCGPAARAETLLQLFTDSD